MLLYKLAARAVGLCALACAAGEALEAFAQPPTPETYSDYYNQELQELHRPSTNVAGYTYNKYYYHNPAVSPYLSLLRAPGIGTDAYYQYVQPEEQRREAVQMRSIDQQRARATGGGIAPVGGRTPSPTPTSGAYQNHWYGSRQQMGL